ncbi:hypothetical protein TNCV_3862271 [Trichonephila clavipes]|nr:hypothetical protein TNCV_3862271 [Trichonephila clavipes]
MRIAGNINSNQYISEVLSPEAGQLLQGFPGTLFQPYNAPHIMPGIIKAYSIAIDAAFTLACLFPGYIVYCLCVRFRWLAFSSGSSSKSSYRGTMGTRANVLFRADIQNLFDSMLLRSATLIERCDGCTKYAYHCFLAFEF